MFGKGRKRNDYTPDLNWEIIKDLDFEPVEPPFVDAIEKMEERTKELQGSWWDKHAPDVVISGLSIVAVLLSSYMAEQYIAEPMVRDKKEEHLRKADGYERCLKFVESQNEVSSYKNLKVDISTLSKKQIDDCGIEANSSGERALDLPSEDELVGDIETEKNNFSGDYFEGRTAISAGGLALAALPILLAMGWDRRQERNYPVKFRNDEVK